ncbi:MAG: ankyrin repeat domain-containing protein [Synergistaceae bacterium]|nr:ankyrin repeat domain-containing protein [Synergistaceae bacterium]
MRKVLFAVFILVLFSSSALAADQLTFNGELTVNGQEISGSGTVSMPKPKAVWTQDDDPGVMAGIFKEEGYDNEEAALKIETSESFSVSGSRVNGVFAIQSGELKSIGGSEAPYEVPAEPGDYYIGINNTPEEDELQEDAAMLQYVKISVTGAAPAPKEASKSSEPRFFNDNTELILAADAGNTKKVNELLKSGSDVNAKNIYGMTALMYAAEGNYTRIVKNLLKSGADINAVNNEGSTSLIIAAIHASEEVIDVLVEAGADLKIKNNNGKTAADYARENADLKDSEVLEKLEVE